MPPNKQQYKMHECCKAVNELKAMTSVISRNNPSILNTYSAYPTFQQFYGTPSAWRPRLLYDSIWETQVLNQQEMFP